MIVMHSTPGINAVMMNSSSKREWSRARRARGWKRARHRACPASAPGFLIMPKLASDFDFRKPVAYDCEAKRCVP